MKCASIATVQLATLLASGATRAQGPGASPAVRQCWVNGVLVTVQAEACPSAPVTTAASSGDAQTEFPGDAELTGRETHPTLRIPVIHYSITTKGIAGRLTGSKGWLEIDANTVRYIAVRKLGSLGEYDIGFEYSRAEITNLKMDTRGADIQARGDKRRFAEFRVPKIQHFLHYIPSNSQYQLSWNGSSSEGAVQAANTYTALIVRAIENFSSVVADFQAQQPAIASSPPAVPAVVASELKPQPPPPPVTILIVNPAGVTANEAVETTESPLNIRGVAMGSSGLPTVSINGAPAMLRPKGAQAVEFWSDPLPLSPGNNSIQIVASNAAHAETKVAFTVHYVTKAAPVNLKGLDKAEIISLLVGGVPAQRVVDIVNERGVKFSPTTDDLKVIRAAGGTDDLINAIQKIAPH